MSNPLVKILCVGKYRRLSKYFDDLQFKDLLKTFDISPGHSWLPSSTEKMIPKTCEVNDVIIMTCFFKNELLPIIARMRSKEDPYILSAGNPSLPKSDSYNIGLLIYGHLLYLRKHIERPDSNLGINITLLPDLLESLDSEGVHRKNVYNVNLMDSALTNEDLPYIVSIVNSLPNCKMVSLRNNNLKGKEAKKYIKILLKKGIIVDVCKNKFVKHVRMKPKLYKKLIWIDENELVNVEQKLYKYSNDLSDTIIETHNKFYNDYYDYE